MQLKLTPRLKKITQLIKQDSRVADIGTDHGYIPIYLLENKIAAYVIASDVNEGPLETAKKNIEAYGYANQAELRLGSGLETLQSGEVDTVIIAGMGGILITELLQVVPQVTKEIETFILQPMQAQQELRRYLVNNGFAITQDLLVKEDTRIYEIIVVQKGEQVIEDEIYYEIGFHLKSNPKALAEEFLLGKINAQKEIIASVKGQNSPAAMEKHQECIEKVTKLKEVLEWVRN